MAKTYQRKSDKRWVAVQSLGFDKQGKRIRRVFYGDTKRDAERKRDDQIAREGGRLRVRPQAGSFGDWMTSWLAEYARTSAPTTSARYAGVWKKHAEPLIGHKRLATFGTDDVAVLYRRLQDDGVSAATIAKLRVVLHKAIEVARKRRIYLDQNPFSTKLVEPPRYVTKEQKWLHATDARRLIATCAASGDRLEAAVVLALAAGMRLGEIFGLKWEDVDWRGKSLAIRRSLQEVGGRFTFSTGKTTTARRKVSLGSVALEALRRRKKIAESAEYVFTTTDGTHVNRTSFRERHFNPLLVKAKVPKVRFHDLRHSFASMLLQRGVATKVASEALGHASPAITQRIYQHVGADLQQQAITEIDRALRPRAKRGAKGA